METEVPSPPPRSSHLETVLTVLLVTGSFGLFLIFAWPLFQGRLYIEDDLAALYLPVRDFYSKCLANGYNFLWMPHLSNGFYIHGEGHGGFLHPLHYVLYRFFPLDRAFMLELLLSYPVMYAGMYAFLRRWTVERPGALYGALLITFIGCSMNHYVHISFVGVMAHLPWALLAIDTAMRNDNPSRATLGIAGVVGLSVSQIYLGNPQVTYFSWLIEGLYALFLLGLDRRFTRLLQLGIAKALAIAVGAAQLLPTLAAYQASMRHDPTLDYQLGISLHPWNLLQMVSPYLFHGRVYAPLAGDEPWDAPYFGAATLPLLMLLFLCWPRSKPQRALAWAALALAVFALLAMLGKYGFLYHVLNRIPVVNFFRAPARYVAVFHVGMAVCCALSFSALLRIVLSQGSTRPGNYLRILRGATLKRRSEAEELVGAETAESECRPSQIIAPRLSSAGDVDQRESLHPQAPAAEPPRLRVAPVENDACSGVLNQPPPWKRLAPLATVPILSMGVVTCVLAFRFTTDVEALSAFDRHVMRTPSIAFGALLAIAASVLIILAARGRRAALPLLVVLMATDITVYSLRHKPAEDLPTILSQIPTPPGDNRDRIEPNIVPYTMNQVALQGYRSSTGYLNLFPETYLDYAQPIPMQLAGVRWRQSRLGTSPELNAAKEAGIDWLELDNPMPRARLVGNAVVSADPLADLATIDIATTALVLEPLILDGAAPGVADLGRDTPGHIEVTTASTGAQLLVVSENYNDGWRATVDGAPASAIRAYGDFLGVVVPAGDHSVTFHFWPAHFTRGLVVSACAILLSIGYLVLLGFPGARLKRSSESNVQAG